MEQIKTVPAARTDSDLNRLAEMIREVIEGMEAFEDRFADEISRAHPQYRTSAANLVHYLALRQYDLRDLQQELARLGLSSLGRAEAHVLASVEAVARVISNLRRAEHKASGRSAVTFPESTARLVANTNALFGDPPNGRSVRIMVTLPSEAADDYYLVRDLIAAGMDIARINCGRDDEGRWCRMADHVRKARNETGRRCRISMDLAGNKPRTGALEPGPEVVRWKPQRDLCGQVVEPARIWLAPEGVTPPSEVSFTVSLPVDGEWLSRVQPGDRIRLRDARRRKRVLNVTERWGAGVLCESDRTAYVTTGTVLRLQRQGNRKRARPGRIGRLPAVAASILLKEGDTLVLTRENEVGRPARLADDGCVEEPAHIACSLPDLLDDVKPGESVRFDDGKIDGVITSVEPGEVRIEITRAGEEGRKLRAGRSINFPQSRLKESGMSPKDVADLDLVLEKADIVGLSFASKAEDVIALHEEMAARKADGAGIILKIETVHGFQNLPWLLLAAMQRYPFGVMIARGDLAVECGWERTAEVQEEILWLCEAAHVPVIWATQVLEELAQKGFPTRAEITDAAMAERAECVMLNKGLYIMKAIRTLDDVLRRMQGHQTKKTALLRSLNVSNVFSGIGAKEVPVN